MRIAKTVILVLVIPIFLSQSSLADITPDPVWPPYLLMDRDAAHNLTTWFATSLNAQIDTNGTGEWFTLNESNLPIGLRAEESYFLPLLNGGVEARYISTGTLKDIVLEGETQYIAQSNTESETMAVTYEIAEDLGLNYSQAEFHHGYETSILGEIPEEIQHIVLLEEQSAFGDPYNFNRLIIGFNWPDMRVVYVYATVWFEATGDPAINPEEALFFSQDYAVNNLSATDAVRYYDHIAVWNGTTYVYLVHTHWDVGSDSSYYLDEWVDVNTGEVLGRDGPLIVVDEGVLPFGNWFWAIIAIVATSLVVGLAMFYRINSDRALDHFTRGRIFGYLQANPGATYTMVRESLSLGNGTAAYHLWVLERLGFVRSVSKGRIKQFYPRGVSLSKGSLVLTRLQYSILDLLEAEGPLSQVNIAKSLEMSRQRAHYNVKVLRSMELVERTGDKKEGLTYKGEEAIADGENGLFVSPSSETEPTKDDN